MQVKQQLLKAGLRVQVDARSEKLGYKIREAQLAKVPYTLVIGDQEASEGTVSVRRRGVNEQKEMGIEQLARQLSKQVAARELNANENV